MPDCINSGAAVDAFNNNANPAGVRDNQPNGPGYFDALNRESQESLRQERQARADAEAVINSAVGNQGDAIINPTPSAQAGAAARMLFAETAKQGIQNLKDRAQSIFDKLFGVNSLGKLGIYLQLSTKLSSIFKNKQAPLETFFVAESPFYEGRNFGAHTAVEALRGIDRKSIGFMRDFNATFFDPFLKSIETRAQSLGMSSLEFARAIGDYAVMMHMPEANQYLLDNWRRDFSNAVAAKDFGKAKKIGGEIKRLMQYLDWTENMDENGHGIRCAGRTNGAARKWIDDFHSKYNVDRAEMEQYARDLSTIVTELNKWNISRGNVPVEDAQLIENTGFEMYVPLKATKDISNHLPTDATILNAGNFHSREGMDSRTPIASAYDSIYNHAQRISMDNACQDLGISLSALQQNALAQGRRTPIQIHDYNVEVAKAQAGGSFGTLHRNIIEGRDGFMLTAMLPEQLEDGTFTVKRKIITFEDSFVDERGISGHELNEAMRSVQQDALLKMASKATGFLGSLNTHYNLAFSPLNMGRDFGERVNNLFGQTFRLEDGTVVDGSKFAGAYAAAMPKAMRFLTHLMTGKVPDVESSPIGRHWREYVTQGIKQEFDPTRHKEGAEISTVLDTLRKDKTAGPMLNLLSQLDIPMRQKILNGIHNWNDYFNNIAAFAEYHALRENGVSVDSASTGVLEVVNLRENGTMTPWLRAWWAFAKPTMQGAASMLRSVGLSPNAAGQFKPSVKGLAFMAGQGIAYALAFSMYKSAVGDEMADSKSMDEVARYMFIPVGKDGEAFKLPIPFGISPIAATAFIGVDRVLRGVMEPMDYVGHLIRQVFKATSPAEFPAYAMSDGFGTYMLGMFTPSALQPVFQVVANKGYFGQEITTGDSNSTTPMYMQGKATTPSGWGAFAKLLNVYSGGLINAAPEQVKTMIEGYFGGVTQVFPDLINRNSLASMGFDDSTRGQLGTTMCMLGASMLYDKIPMTHTRQYYTEYNALKKEIRDYGLKLSEKGAYGNTEEREALWREKLFEAGMDTGRVERYLAMVRADQKKKKLTEEFKMQTTQNPDFPDLSHDAMRDLFVEYMNRCEELYVEALGI